MHTARAAAIQVQAARETAEGLKRLVAEVAGLADAARADRDATASLAEKVDILAAAFRELAAELHSPPAPAVAPGPAGTTLEPMIGEVSPAVAAKIKPAPAR